MTEHLFFFCPQHIITQDFARNQDAPQAPPATSSSGTFQSSAPTALSTGPGRAKMASRYSPESQGQPPQAPHHPRASSRVSPENALDKPRARYCVPMPPSTPHSLSQSCVLAVYPHAGVGRQRSIMVSVIMLMLM